MNITIPLIVAMMLKVFSLICRKLLISFAMVVSCLTKMASGDLQDILLKFCYDRKQRVVLNGQVPSWTNVTAGAP